MATPEGSTPKKWKKKKAQNKPQGVGLLSRMLLGIFILFTLMRKTSKQRRVNIDLI